MAGVHVNESAICIDQLAFKARWRTHIQGARRDHRIRQYQGARSYNRAFADSGVIQNHRAHADEAMILDGATVQNGTMPYGDPIADYHGGTCIGVDHCSILEVAVRTYADWLNVAAQDGLKPDAGVFANFDLSNQVRALSNKRGRGNAWRALSILQNHG
jgi:hypothetical protein